MLITTILIKNKATNLIFKPERLQPFKIAADLNLVEHVHYSTGERRAITQTIGVLVLLSQLRALRVTLVSVELSVSVR